MKTLLLDRTAWDLTLDAQRNIAVASNPYSLAQDAASAIRLFRGELWYDTAKGVPYFENILGQAPSVPFMKARYVAAALSVPETKTARCFLNGVVQRRLTGQVQLTSLSGFTVTAGF